MEINSFMKGNNFLRKRCADKFSWDRMDCHSGEILIWVRILIFIRHEQETFI